MPTALLAEVQLSIAVLVAQRYFEQVDVAVTVDADALSDPTTIMRFRLEGQYLSFRANEFRGQ